MKNLSTDDIQFLIEFGFVQTVSLYSGHFHFGAGHHKNGDSSRVSVLIALEDGSYKMEFYEWLPDGDGDWYEDFSSQKNQPNQSLVEFIQSIFI